MKNEWVKLTPDNEVNIVDNDVVMAITFGDVHEVGFSETNQLELIICQNETLFIKESLYRSASEIARYHDFTIISDRLAELGY